MTEAHLYYVVNQDGDEDGTFTEHPSATIRRTEAALNAAYRERAHLVALLAALWPSHIGVTDPTTDWPVVTVELPTGQACWHVSPNDVDLFGHVEPTPRYARGWDGHSTEEKYERVDQITRQVQKSVDIPAPQRLGSEATP